MSSNPRIIYVLIDATPEPGSKRVDRTNSYDKILDANKYIHHRGPPLPILIQCLAHQEDDLKQLKTLVKSVRGGGSNASAEAYVKGVIPLVENLGIWEHIPKFYVCLGGADATKYVAQHWKYISDVTSGDVAITPSFTSFTHAFIYALAGGDAKLKEMGLYNTWGWNQSPAVGSRTSKDTRPPSTPLRAPPGPSPSSSKQPTFGQSQPPTRSCPMLAGDLDATPSTSMQVSTFNPPFVPKTAFTPSIPRTPMKNSNDDSSLVDDGRSPTSGEVLDDLPQSNSHDSEWPSSPLQNKGKQRASPLPVSGRDTPFESTTPRLVLKPKATTSTTTSSSTRSPRFCNPASLIPLSLLTNPRLSLRSLPVVCRRTATHSGGGDVVKWLDLDVHDSSLLLPAATSLPPFIEYGVRALGWGPDMLKVVEVSWSSQGPRDAFVLTLAEAGMPMAEGYFVWELIQREVGRQQM